MVYSAHYKRTLSRIMEQENKFLIPLAVIIAGALVAGVVFFKSQNTAPTTDGGIDTTVDIPLEPVSVDDHILGNPDAQIKIVEFSDIECPFCTIFHATMHKIMDEYGKDGQVAWVFRNMPLDQLHPDARAKAESAECVASLAGNEVYWKYMDALFTRDETAADLPAIAAEMGVDQTAFATCLSEKRFADKVKSHGDAGLAAGEAAQKAGIIEGIGTPMSILVLPDGTKTVLAGAQPYEIVKQVLETALKGE